MAKVRTGLAYLSAANYLAVIFGIAKMVVASRYLTPTEMGVFGIGFAIAYFTQCVHQFGVGDYILAAPELSRDDLRRCFTVTAMFASGLAVAALLLADAIGAFFGEPSLAPLIRLLALSAFTAPFIIIVEFLLQRRMQFGRVGILQLVTGIVDCVVIIVLTTNGVGAISLAWGALAMGITGVCLVTIMDARNVLFLPKFSGLLPVLRFGGMATCSTLLYRIGDMAPTLVIGRVLGSAQVGYYGRGQSAMTFFRQAVEFSTGKVAQSWFADTARKDVTTLAANYLRVMRLISGLAWPFYVAVIFNAATLIPLLFGSQWGPSIPVAQALAVGGMFANFSFYGKKLLAGRGYVGVQLNFDIASQILRIAFLLLAVPHGIVAVAWAMSISHIMNFGIMSFMLRQTTDVRFRAVARSCISSIVVVAMVALANFGFYEFAAVGRQLSLLQLAAVGMLSGLAWMVGLILVNHDIWREARRPLAYTPLRRWL